MAAKVARRDRETQGQAMERARQAFEALADLAEEQQLDETSDAWVIVRRSAALELVNDSGFDATRIDSDWLGRQLREASRILAARAGHASDGEPAAELEGIGADGERDEGAAPCRELVSAFGRTTGRKDADEDDDDEEDATDSDAAIDDAFGDLLAGLGLS